MRELDAIRAATGLEPLQAPAPVAAVGELVPTDFGIDKTPTIGMIRKGHVGNGAYQEIDPAVLEEHRQERVEARQQAKLNAIAEHEEQLVTELKTAAEVRTMLIQRGKKILEKEKAGIPLTASEVETMRLVEKNIGAVEDRIVGKVKNEGDGKTGDINVAIVAMFAGKAV